MYTLQQGPVERKILEDCMRTGRKVPDRIQNAPELNFGLMFYYQAFLQLSRERPQGFGVTAIPLDAIVSLASWEQLSVDETEDLMYHIREMDTAFMEWQRKQQGG